MTQENDILARFKLIGDPRTKETKAHLPQEQGAPELFEGFFGLEDDTSNDLFNSFLNKASKVPGQKEEKILTKEEKQEKYTEKQKEISDQIKEKTSNYNFIKKAFNKLFGRTVYQVSTEAGKFVSTDNARQQETKQREDNIFKANQKPGSLFDTSAKPQDASSLTENLNLDYSLISKIADISLKEKAQNMEDIIRSEQLAKSDLQKLFVNYINKSVEESSGTGLIDQIVADTTVTSTIINAARGEIDRAELEEVFIDFINKNEAKLQATEQKVIETETSKIILEFAAAINPDYMTRDELEELFVRYCRNLSINAPDAFKELQSILANALPNAFVPDDGEGARVESILQNFHSAINPDYMTRSELEELFIRYTRELSVRFPDAWASMAQMLSNAIAVSFSPDMSMDDQSRAAIAGFAGAINPESMTRDTLEELFTRFARQVSIQYPAAWAELQGMLSVALGQAYIPDISMDAPSRAAIAGFSQAIKPEMMTRDELEELFIRFARQVSVQYPAAWSEMQAMLSVALGQSYVPDMTMDDASRSAIAGFQLAIKPEFMKRDQLEELFTRFVRQVSIQFPVAIGILSGILNQALPNAYVEPVPEMDDYSVNVIESFQQVIKPETMTREDLEAIFVKFIGQISAKFPTAHATIRNMLNVAISSAFIPDITMDEPSRQAIAGFAQAIKPEVMTRETLEELFIRFGREVSVKFPAAWAELQGMLSVALGQAYIPDISMDAPSRTAIAGFSQAIKPEMMTRDELEELFIRFARQISVKFPAAWSEMQGMLSFAVSNSFVPDMSMDAPSRAAIAGFSQAIKPDMMTRDTLEELFIRFTREVSIKFPAAWTEMQGMLAVAISHCFIPDNTMDDQSRSAIAGFSQAIKPEIMTRETLEELFTRFAREVSIRFPAAWTEMQGMLSVALGQAYVPDTTMDDESRSSIAFFSQAINPEVMTRETLEELFIRYARQISIKYPAAWTEMQGMLRVAVANAFIPDTTMDDDSRSAIAGFQLAIKPEIMTREELESLFTRFVKEVSINFPAAWAEMQGTLNTALPHAFIPDTTMNDDTKYLIAEFESILHNQEFTGNQLEDIFADYMRQVPLMFPVVKSILENKTREKRGDSNAKDSEKKKQDIDFINIDKEIKKVSEQAKILDVKAQGLTKDLKEATNKDEIKDKQDALRKIQGRKHSLDREYSISAGEAGSNIKATQNIDDDYIQELNLSFDKKDDRELFEITTQKFTNWDMLRTLRREEVLGVMNELPKENLVESLYVVPKYMLKQALIQLPVEDMTRVLFNARFPEALLRAMPRSKAIELLPSPDQMLPILMTMGHISGFKNGCDLIENVVINGLKVEPEQNETRSEEEIQPFVMKQLIGNTPRLADAQNPAQGKINPLQSILKQIEEDPDTLRKLTQSSNPQEKGGLELKYQKPESLMPPELKQLAQEVTQRFGDEEVQETLAAKRGVPAQMLEFLESMKKVKDLASAKMAVSVLSVAQTKAVAKATLPLLETKHLVKISQYYGTSCKELVKSMPRYSIEGLIKALPKHYMIQGFKLLDKSMIIGMLKTQSSQTIARVASEMLARDAVKDTAFKKKGFV